MWERWQLRSIREGIGFYQLVHNWWWCLVAKSDLTLATPWTVACQALLSMGFSRQEYWSGLPSPSPGDLPDPRIESGSPALQADSLPTELWGQPWYIINYLKIWQHKTKIFYHLAISMGQEFGRCLAGLFWLKVSSEDAVKMWARAEASEGFLFHLAAPGLSCGMQDQVLWQGIGPGSPAFRAWSLNHWTTMEAPPLKAWWTGRPSFKTAHSYRCGREVSSSQGLSQGLPEHLHNRAAGLPRVVQEREQGGVCKAFYNPGLEIRHHPSTIIQSLEVSHGGQLTLKEERTDLHLLKGVSKNLWTYFKATKRI